MKRFSKGGDNKAKGMLNALGVTLYYSLEQDQRKIFDNAMQCQLVPFSFDDDEDDDEDAA